jgi:hypothetical protein
MCILKEGKIVSIDVIKEIKQFLDNTLVLSNPEEEVKQGFDPQQFLIPQNNSNPDA